MALINEAIIEGGANPLWALSPFDSKVVIMKTFFTSTTSLLDWAYFHNTTFQLGFFMSSEKTPKLRDKEIWKAQMIMVTFGKSLLWRSQHHLVHRLDSLNYILFIWSIHIWNWPHEYAVDHNQVWICLLVFQQSSLKDL